MTLNAANTSLATYTRFQVKPDSIWFMVTCDDFGIISGFVSIRDAYLWAIKEESSLSIG